MEKVIQWFQEQKDKSYKSEEAAKIIISSVNENGFEEQKVESWINIKLQQINQNTLPKKEGVDIGQNK